MRCEYRHRVEQVLADGDISTTDQVTADVPCYVERITVTELREGELVTIAQWRGFFAPDFMASAGDYIILASGQALELVGPTQPAYNPRERYVHHQEARLREVDA
jgi:hypothetical protein